MLKKRNGSFQKSKSKLSSIRKKSINMNYSYQQFLYDSLPAVEEKDTALIKLGQKDEKLVFDYRIDKYGDYFFQRLI